MTQGKQLQWPPDVKTLSVDVGGSGVKGALLDRGGQMISDRVRIPTPYPCTPQTLLGMLAELGAQLPGFHRVSVGFPGPVRNGVLMAASAFSRREYGGERDPELAALWEGLDLGHAIAQLYDMPTKVVNDADMQGCAVAKGDGFEFVMTLGTGCGTAVFLDGRLLPHLELSHVPFRKRQTIDIQLGNAARKAVGNQVWADRVLEAIEIFRTVLWYDHIYVGGGNAKHLPLARLGPNATIVPNSAGIIGGVRVWDLAP